ncbi:hypothetical protein CBOM_04580 [Ceraceosorus bombacis]|uniref:Uncharacterized protein n=1 Tax=Ceraceosorus bombacis TaxID=401625 RepID=A0A0P1BP48_9BASI|nr:hypothetical protein CBOM_04580 [Ceraceosorus bombacis]
MATKRAAEDSFLTHGESTSQVLGLLLPLHEGTTSIRELLTPLTEEWCLGVAQGYFANLDVPTVKPCIALLFITTVSEVDVGTCRDLNPIHPTITEL